MQEQESTQHHHGLSISDMDKGRGQVVPCQDNSAGGWGRTSQGPIGRLQVSHVGEGGNTILKKTNGSEKRGLKAVLTLAADVMKLPPSIIFK